MAPLIGALTGRLAAENRPETDPVPRGGGADPRSRRRHPPGGRTDPSCSSWPAVPGRCENELVGINQMLARAGSVADRIPCRGEFAGPSIGLVELPNRLCWSGRPVFDVTDPRRRLTLYTTLIGEGQRADLARWINWAHLIEDWPKVRRLTARDLIGVWEKQLPDLAAV